MNVLLDTCTFLWLRLEPHKLSATARRLQADRSNASFLSAVSCWEIAILFNLNRLTLAQPPDLFVPLQRAQHGVGQLFLSEKAALHSCRLPSLHKDPFDRMLVCQAIIDDLTILTPDPLIQQYSVKTAW